MKKHSLGNNALKLVQLLILSAAFTLGTTGMARAEADSFGLGTGRDGALSVTTADTTINIYAAVSATAAAGVTSITVDSVAGFSAGNLVLLWQTTGLTTTDAPRGSQATLDLATTSVGHYEFARVESVNVMTGTLELTLPTVKAYAAGTSQVIRVPEYTTVTVSATGSIVPGQLWDGIKGGVVAFFANGGVTNDGVISANAAGFRGGVLVNHGALNNCNAATMGLPNDNTPANGYSAKGEGLVPSAFNTTAGGRTNVANGGGGGVCHNSGGGGGAHAGRGGGGGRTWAGDGGGRDLGGYGGAALAYDPTLAFAFGGGGGAGDQNNSVGSPGGVGGGVVLIRAATLGGAGFVRANGAKPLRNNGPTANDAAGGGGAGGALIIRVAGALACGGLEANGGGGGDVQYGTTAASDAHGTGGGGGGGRIYIESGAAACPASAKAGLAGVWNGTNAWGATPTSVDDVTSTGVVTIVGAAFAGVSCSAANLAAGLCGGCVASTECPGGAASVCNLNGNTCGACSASFGGGAGACPLSGAPVCVSGGPNAGACGECNSDADCGANINGPICDTEKSRCGVCSASQSASCTGTTAFCDTSVTHNVCAGCNGDAGAAGTRLCTNAAPACETSGSNAGLCVECRSNGHCAGNANGAVCDFGKRLCGACTASEFAACTGASPSCDTRGARNICAACDGNFSSGAPLSCPLSATPFCAASGSSLAGECLQCLSSSDCGGSTPICNAGLGVCVACNGDFGSGANLACGMASPFCAPSGCSSVCVADAQCGSGNWCNSGACQPKVPNGQAVPGGVCDGAVAARACATGVCAVADGLCGLPTGNSTCTASPQCRVGVCVSNGANAGTCLDCNTDSDCSGATPACSGTSNLCVTCTSNNKQACGGLTPVCDVGAAVCVACNGDDGSGATHVCSSSTPFCKGDGSCGACTGNSDCSVGNHSGTICNSTSGACGSACSVDANCSASEYCDNPAGSGFQGSCTPKLANDIAYPASQPFGGMCMASTAGRVCISGACDEADDKCGLPNGQPCASAVVCRTAVCGDGGLCGLPNGQACMNATVCRAGVCFADGVCGTPNGQACAGNGQCRGNVCASDKICGLPNGESCVADNECRTNKCFADGRCGIPAGEACTATDLCRQGACTNGQCVVPIVGDAGVGDGGLDAGGLEDGGALADGGPGSDADAQTLLDSGAGGNGEVDADPRDQTLRVGGGGCACDVSHANGKADVPGSWMWLMLIGLVWRRRTRKRPR
ncbi:MAG: hypothetical protein SF187_28550 [Deltaproteobacteria bacterium]|nr:hypothetical protein [Deltaproteobacteria bacterium]